MNLIISQQLAQAIADYLTRQPYGEVAGLIQPLAQLMPVNAKTPGAAPARLGKPVVAKSPKNKSSKKKAQPKSK